MEGQENTQTTPEKENTTMYYVIGAVVLVAVLVAGYFLRPKPQTPAQQSGQQQQAAVPQGPTPTPGPITGLACENQYYNPVVGVNGQYYLSVEGSDLATSTKETCDFTVTVNRNVIATLSREAQLSANSERGGSIWRCTTDKLTLEKNVPTKVDVTVTNDQSKSVTCTRTFLLP